MAGFGGELGHHQRRREPLARDVAHDDGQAVVRQADEVIVIAPHRVDRLVMSEELVAGHGRNLRHDPRCTRPASSRSRYEGTSMVLSGVLKERGRSAVNPHPAVDLVISTWSYRAIPDGV